MIGREIASTVYPPKPERAAARRRASRSATCAGSDRLQRRLAVRRQGRDRRPRRPRRPGPAGAAAGAVRRAARRRGRRSRSTASRAPASSPAAAKTRGRRHGADPRGPQDRGADAADVDRRQSRPSPRCGALSRGPFVDARQGARGGRRTRSSGCRSRSATPADAGRDAVGRQPAEGRHRQVADDRAAASSCSTTRPAASTSAPSRRSTGCCASSPTPAPPSCSTSTDYDELIGCCDRVADHVRRRAIARELEGERRSPRRNIVASSLNLGARRRRGRGMSARRAGDAGARRPAAFACARTAACSLPSRSSSFSGSSTTRSIPRASSSQVMVQNANEAFALALRRHGADRAGAARRPRPVGRRGDDAGRLRRQPSSSAARPADRCSASSLCLAAGALGGLRQRPASSSTAASSRSSRRWRPARSTSASRCSCARRRAARSTRTCNWAITNDALRAADDLSAWFDGGRPPGSADRLAAGAARPARRWSCCSSGCRSAVGHRPRRLRRRLGRGRGLHVGPADRARQDRRLHAGRLFAGLGGLFLAIQTSSGNADIRRPAPTR